eukprot:COSAG06_NODE_15894_length_1037_cov_0.697228_1_plen_87_part_00
MECQGFGGTLDVACIKGGFVTQLEAAEMERIMREAKSDCLKSGIVVEFDISELSYYEFLQDYDFLEVQDYELLQDCEVSDESMPQA